MRKKYSYKQMYPLQYEYSAGGLPRVISEELSLLGCAVWLGYFSSTFRRYVPPSISGL